MSESGEEVSVEIPGQSLQNEKVTEEKAVPEKLNVYINAKGQYYAASARISSGDSELKHPAEKLREVLSTSPGEVVDRMIVHEAVIHHGNGEGSQYTNSGVSPL